MILYSEEPVSHLDASLLKAWMAHREAQLFKECVIAEMNQNYFEAINLQTKGKSKEDKEKFAMQAQPYLDRARELHDFLAVFEQLAAPSYGFHKLKINT